MNRIEKKENSRDAAKLFEQEVAELSPGLPQEELCSMVDDYIYYQQDEITRAESRAIIEETCLNKRRN